MDRFRWITPSLATTQGRLYQTNAGVFVRDGEAYAIDPSVFPDEIDGIASFIANTGARLRGIVLTHSHWDHILGPERFADVVVIAHRSFASNLAQALPAVVKVIAEREDDEGIKRSRTFAAPAVDVAVGETATLPLGVGGLQIFHAPGHCADQIIVYDSIEKALWAADMLSDIEIPFVDDILAYRRTLQRIMTLDIAALVPGHGSPTSDAGEIRNRLRQDDEYLGELQHVLTNHIDRGGTLAQILQSYGLRPVRNRQVNAKEHLRNIEAAYATLVRNV